MAAARTRGSAGCGEGGCLVRELDSESRFCRSVNFEGCKTLPGDGRYISPVFVLSHY